MFAVERKGIIQRKKRISYYDDYKKTASGEYVYTGPEFEFISKTGKERKRWMLEMLLLSALVFIAEVIPGFLHVPGLNYCAYVLLPYAAGILVAGYIFIILVRLAAAKDSVKLWEFDKSITPLPVATKALCVMGAVSVAGEIVYLAVNGVGEMIVGTVVYMVCHVIAVFVSVLMVRLVGSVEWRRKMPEGI